MDLVTPEYFTIQLADSYFKAGATEKGLNALSDAYSIFDDELSYFFSLKPKFIQTEGMNEEIQRDIFYLQIMERIARSNGQTEFAKKVADSMQAYFARYSG